MAIDNEETKGKQPSNTLSGTRGEREADGAECRYTLSASGEATIIGCAPLGEHLVIPEQLDGHPVTAIANQAFARMAQVASIELPPTLRCIGHCAFERCTALQRISFPTLMDTFKADWLRGCTNLREVRLPGMAPTIEQGIFTLFPLRVLHVGPGTHTLQVPSASPLQLDELTIHADNPHLRTDGTGLYHADTLVALVRSCERYHVADDCVRIGPYAFAYRTELREVRFPDTLVELGDLACLHSGLREFTAPLALRSIGMRAFANCDQLRSIQLNDGLQTIGESAFAHTGLHEPVVIPPSVRELGSSVTGPPDEIVRRGLRMRLAADNPALLMDTAGLLYRRTDGGLALHDASYCTEREVNVVPSTTAIDPGACKLNAFLEHVALPEGLHTIGAQAFSECSKLTSVTLPDTLREIGDFAFYGTSLETVRIPAACTTIGCRSLDTTARRLTPYRDGSRVITRASMRRAQVDPANPVYYMDGSLLCCRLKDGGSEVVLHTGTARQVEIPRDVTRIGMYAFSGACDVEELRLHANIEFVEAAGLFPAIAYRTVVVELPEPADGHASVRVDLTPDELGMRVIRAALKDTIRPRLLMEFYDSVIPYMTSHFDRFTRMLDRLEAPVYLAPWARNTFLRELTLDPLHTCTVLVEHDCPRSLRQLAEFGLLDATTARHVIDAFAGNPTVVSALACLLELKRTKLEHVPLDFEL